MRAFTLVFALLIANCSALFAADVVLQKVPPLTVEQAPAYPENVARYHLGAEVEAAPQSNPIASLQLSSRSEDNNAAEAALLCNDPTVGYALPSGTSTILVSLQKIENIDSISFLNKGAKGDVTIATASAKLPADSPQWKEATKQDLSDAVQAKVGPSEAKYVRLTFNVTEPGRIAGFGVYSTPSVSDFTMPRQRKMSVKDRSETFALISYNLTDIHAKARTLYVSSGSDVKQANNMIDDQTATSYSFATEDGTPTTVIDLGKVCSLKRLSAIYSPRAGSIDFYVLQSLPGGGDNTVELNLPGDESGEKPATGPLPDSTPENMPKSLKMDDSAFATLKPVGSVTDDGTQGRASVDFPATSGRYVMVRWTPSAQQDSSFTVAEVAAFGDTGQDKTLLASRGDTTSRVSTESTESIERELSESDGKEMVDAKDMVDSKDAKDIPGEGADERADPPGEGPPPSLPQPPPFTFVPQLVPTSP